MKNKLKLLLSNKDVKTLLENFFSLSVLRIIGYIFPLMTIPYLARVIGVDKFGELAFASSVIIFFITFIDYGFNYTATRDVARNKTNLKLVSKIYSTIMVARIILLIISFFVLLLLINLITILKENETILLLTFTYVIGYTLFPEWVFQAIEKMKFITIMNVISKSIFTILVFTIILNKDDYIYQPILIGVGYLVSGILSMIILSKKFKVKFIIPFYSDVKKAIINSSDMFFTLFIPNLYTNFSVIYLTKIHGDTSTGIFSSGFKFVEIFDQLIQVLSRTFYPFLSRKMNKHDYYMKIGLVFSLFASVSLFLLSSILVNLFYTNEFTDAVLIIKIMSICPFFLFLINTYGPNYLVIVGKEKTLRNIVFFCSLFGFILTCFLTYLYEYIGIAITLTIIWGIRGFITFYYANKHKRNNQSLKNNND